MIPVECVARGYLTGSGLLDYQKTGEVSGIALPPGLVGGQQVRLPAVHAGHQGRARPARREHLVRRRDRHGRRRARQPAARPHPADLHPRRRPRLDEGNHHRRHQIRVRRRRARRPGAGRRGLHPGLVAVLGRRHLSGGRRPAQLRQAVRPQLADESGIGLGPRRRQAAAPAAARPSWMPPASAISMPTSAFRVCSSPTGSARPRDRSTRTAQSETGRAPPRVSRRRLRRPVRVAARQVRSRGDRIPGGGELLHRTGHRSPGAAAAEDLRRDQGPHQGDRPVGAHPPR